MELILQDKFIYLNKLSPAQKKYVKEQYQGGKWVNNDLQFRISKLYARKLIENKIQDSDIVISEEVKRHFDFSQTSYKYNFSEHLYDWQKNSLRDALNNKTFLLAWDTGTGKTIGGLELFYQYKLLTGKKGIIIAPFQTLYNAWYQDLRKFYDKKLSYIICWDTRKEEKYRKVSANRDLYIINTEMLTSKYFDELMNRWGGDIDFILYDECSSVKYDNTYYDKLLKVKNNFSYRYFMSGLPAPNNESEFFPLFNFLDDRMLGDSYIAFRHYYYRPNPDKPYKYELKEGKLDEMLTDIKPKVHFISKNAVYDFPKVSKIIINLSMDTNQLSLFNEMKANFELNITGDLIDCENELSKLIKLREISRGFIKDKNGYDKTISLNVVNHLTKLILSEKTKLYKTQFIIWFEFKWEAMILSKLLDKLKISYSVINSDTSQKLQPILLSKFRTNKTQCLLAQIQSIAHGVRLENCSRAIWFSMSYSEDYQKQSEDRIYRYPQKRPVAFFILKVKDSVDDSIIKILSEKRKRSEYYYKFFKKEVVNV